MELGTIQELRFPPLRQIVNHKFQERPCFFLRDAGLIMSGLRLLLCVLLICPFVVPSGSWWGELPENIVLGGFENYRRLRVGNF